MRFTATLIPGVWIVEPQPVADSRGYFARTWCRREFEEHGLNADLVQCGVSWSAKRATLRGLHYQRPPWSEAKLVRSVHGAIYDVAVDLRPDSPAFRRHVAVVLTGGNRKMLYVPEGCAHGFQTLCDETEVAYQMSQYYSPEHAAGVRWDDPAFRIDWPPGDRTLSERDRCYPDFKIAATVTHA